MRVPALVVLAVAAALAAMTAAPAGAADECKGLQVCLPVAGPWVVVPAGPVGVDWELACPLRSYTVGGTDARVATRDVDVSFRGRTGSPVSPGVTTGASVVFHGVRTSAAASGSSFKPFLGCIPGSGGGGRSLTSRAASGAGFKPAQALFSVVVSRRVTRATQLVRAACPSPARLVGATYAIGFDQTQPPSAAQRAAVTARRTVAPGVVVRVTAQAPIDPSARVQVRALCTRSR